MTAAVVAAVKARKGRVGEALLLAPGRDQTRRFPVVVLPRKLVSAGERGSHKAFGFHQSSREKEEEEKEEKRKRRKREGREKEEEEEERKRRRRRKGKGGGERGRR